VSALLRGEGLAIKPEGFDQTHRRNAGHHRLNDDEHKWQPYGIGDTPAITPPDPFTNGNGKHRNGKGGK
jgi:hypothetical protein